MVGDARAPSERNTSKSDLTANWEEPSLKDVDSMNVLCPCTTIWNTLHESFFIGNGHINQLKEGERCDASFESNNQLKDGWHFVFDDAFVLIRHHLDD